MKNNFNIHIYTRLAKANKQGLLPIYFYVRVNGKRWEFSTKTFINPKTWDSKNSKIKGNSNDVSIINGQVEVFKSKINIICLEYNFRNEALTIDRLKGIVKGKSKSSKRPLIQIFQKHNKLLSINPKYNNCIQLQEEDTLIILGVVTSLIRQKRKG